MMKSYFQLNLLISLGFILVFIFKKALDRKNSKTLSANFWLRFSQFTLVGVILSSLLTGMLPKKYLFTPLSKPGVQSLISKTEISLTQKLPMSSALKVPAVHTTEISISTLLLFAVIFGSLVLALRVLRLWFSLSKLPVLRSIGKVRIALSQNTCSPFSAWVPGKAYIVIPEHLLLKQNEMHLAIRHEIQHHRQRDTIWVYFSELVKAVFFLNPFIYFWTRLTNNLQEFACDEFLVRIRKVSLQAYGGCLLEAAEIALKSRTTLVGTTSMAAGFEGKLLNRRIEMLFEYRRIPSRSGLILAIIIGTTTILATAAFASRDLNVKHELSFEEAASLAKKSNKDEKFPVEMNRMVLEQLNKMIATEGSRDFFKESLVRMKKYEPMIQQKIAGFELADELLAVPIIESGYENKSYTGNHGAGIWSFIVSTGKKYGLHITEPGVAEKDERLVEHRETLAAMRYFTHLRHTLFKDWRLALRAYNEGENHVEQLIKKHGTRDAWKLEEFEKSSENYLPKVIAAVIIMRNPSLLD